MLEICANTLFMIVINVAVFKLVFVAAMLLYIMPKMTTSLCACRSTGNL